MPELGFPGGAHFGADGAFITLDFPEDEYPAMLYVEYVSGSLQIEDPEEVAAAKLVFDNLRSQALSPADSAALLRRAANELWGE